MKRLFLGASSGVLVLTLACGPGTSGVGTGSGDDSGSGTDTEATSSMSPTTSTTTAGTTVGTADGTATSSTTTTGPLDTGSDGVEVTTDPGTTTGETTEGGSSSGDPPPVSYPGCMVDADCSDPYALCWPPPEFGTPNFCTLECNDVGECPEGDSGTATPVCEGPPDTTICVLDCSGMAECPDGMMCIDVFGNGQFLRCVRQ